MCLLDGVNVAEYLGVELRAGCVVEQHQVMRLALNDDVRRNGERAVLFGIDAANQLTGRLAMQRQHAPAEDVRTGDRKTNVPKGASGQLGEAELEAIQKVLQEG